MKQLNTNISSAVLALTAGIALSACGQNGNQNGNFVKTASVTLATQQGDLYADVKATLDTGNTQLPSVTLPVFDPHNPAMKYGTVSMAPAIGGGTEFTVGVDLTTTAHIANTAPLLPNGLPLPIGGIDTVPVITLPLDQASGAVLYLTFTQKVALIGAALPIKEFQAIGNQIGGINFFPSFALPQGIKGIAGVFAGDGAKANGVALFFDFSSILPKIQPAPTTVQSSLAKNSLMMKSMPIEADGGLTYVDVMPDSASKSVIDYQLYKLHRKHAKLHLSH